MNLEQMWAAKNLSELGFTTRESEFLYLIGTQTGVFTTAQFRCFADVQRGKAQDHLLRTLDAHRLITRIGLTERDHVIHISGKAFYRAILSEDSRLRRSMSPALMRQRLQYGDYIVRNPELHYLTSEAHKHDYLVHQLGVDPTLLPQAGYHGKQEGELTVRFFPDRFPIFSTAVEQPGVGIVYGEDPGTAYSSFRRFITNNRSWLEGVASLHFVYISSSPRRKQLAMSLLSSLFDGTHTVSSSDLTQYFGLRQRLELRQENSFTPAEIAFWSANHRRFSLAKYEPLYAEFCGQQSLHSVSCASPRRNFYCESFTPVTDLKEGLEVNDGTH